MKGQAVPNHKRRKGNKLEGNIYLAVHKTLNKQKQVNYRKHHIPINTNTECQCTQLPHQKTPVGKLD
jgi:hypothetical protein